MGLDSLMVKIGQISIIYIVSIFSSVIQSGLVLMACTGVLDSLIWTYLFSDNESHCFHAYILHIISVSANNAANCFYFICCVCI